MAHPGDHLVWVAVILLFAAHVWVGANRNDLTLGLAGLQGIMLAVILATRWGAEALARLTGRPFLVLCALCGFVVLSGAVTIIVRLTDATSMVPFNRQASSVGLLQEAGLACSFMIGSLIGTSHRCRKAFFTRLITLGAVYALLSLAFFAWAGRTADLAFQQNRLSGSFVSPNVAASLFGMISLLSFAGTLKRLEGTRLRGRFIDRGEQLLMLAGKELVALSLAGLCLLLTSSRLALACLLLSLPVLFGHRYLARISWAGLALSAIALAALTDNRWMTMPADLNWRLDLWRAHLAAFRHAPWFGYGPGSFAAINAAVTTPRNAAHLLPMGALHDIYLQWLEEAGILGTIAIVGLLAWIFANIIGSSQTLSCQQRGILACGVFLLLHASGDYALQVPSIAMQATLLLGVGFGASAAASRQRTPQARTLQTA